MDTTLKRILELIPKKETGEFEHGALKKFANSIGLKSGNVIADWVSGRSNSYKRYVHEIAAKYDVSVAWLKGETDDMGGTGQFQGDSPSGVSGAAAVAAGVVGAALLPGAAIAAIDTAGLSILKGKKKKPDSQKAAEREKEFVQLFNKLTPEQQEFFLAQLRGVVDSQDK